MPKKGNTSLHLERIFKVHWNAFSTQWTFAVSYSQEHLLDILMMLLTFGFTVVCLPPQAGIRTNRKSSPSASEKGCFISIKCDLHRNPSSPTRSKSSDWTTSALLPLALGSENMVSNLMAQPFCKVQRCQIWSHSLLSFFFPSRRRKKEKQ